MAARDRVQGDARIQLDVSAQARNAAIDRLDARRDQAAQYVAELQQAQAVLARTVDAVGETPTDLPFQPLRDDLYTQEEGKRLFLVERRAER